jgi:hypothetical protein
MFWRTRGADQRHAATRPGRPGRAGRDGCRLRRPGRPLVQGRELSITGVFRYANTYPLALQLINSGVVNVTDVITHRFPIEETERALTIGRTDNTALKAIVHTARAAQTPVPA